ncbi:MAG: putative bifunctional diguanylate cyclase/phosphodiesterase [Solirubrobacteraceae bacterium]
MNSAHARSSSDRPGLAVATLRGLLELSRLSLRQPPLPDVLDAVALTVAESVGFSTVVINAYQAQHDIYEVTTVHGSERARQILQGNVTAASTWEPLLDPRFARHGVYFIAAGLVEFDALDPTLEWYTPELPDADPPSELDWRPDDALFAPIEGPGGRRYGVISVDDPVSGRRPDNQQLEVLGALAAHAAVAIESARQVRALEGAVGRHRAVLSSALDCVIAIDSAGQVLEFNPAAERTFGYRAADIVGRDLADLIIPPASREHHRRSIAHGLSTGEWHLLGRRIELLAMRSDGTEFPVELSLALPQSTEADGTVFYGFVRDISERRRGEEQLTYMAYHDALTELPNRILAEEQIELALARARRSDGAVALMFVDLDGFKEVNDRLGHAAGDRVLSGVAARLRSVLRDSDMLARHGGDEFLVLLADLPPDAAVAVEHVGGKLLDSLREPFDLAGRELRAGASIGVSLYPADADDTETLLRHADAAMYNAKAAGGRRLAFHELSEAVLSRRASLSAQLRRAMARDELQLHYQPVWSLEDERRIAGVEALLRWQHPDHGLLRPDAFINTAEQSIAGDELVTWVLSEACRQGLQWRERGLNPLIGINVSHQQLLAPSYVERFADHVRGAGLDPADFMIELTESAWTVDAADTLAVITQLRECGAVVALDDFGAGYTSLSGLRQLACDVIKVDRSLMVGVPGDATATTVARAVLELAGACEAQVVAEGVENERQVTLLRSLGVSRAQGFLFGHPLQGERLTPLLVGNPSRRPLRTDPGPSAKAVRAPLQRRWPESVRPPSSC